jgi:O-antigen ligase
MTTLSDDRNFSEKTAHTLLTLARILSVAMVLGLFASTALIGISEFLILIIWFLILLLPGKGLEQLNISLSSPTIIVSLLLLLLMFFQVFTSESDIKNAFEHFGHYRELLLLPLLIFILNDSKWKKIIYYVFLAGMVLVLIHSYLQYWGLVQNPIPPMQVNTSKLGRIAGAIILAFTSFAFLEEALKNRKSHLFWVWLALFFIGSYAILFLYNGRTGMLIYFLLLLMWGYRFLKLKGMVIALSVTLLLAFIAYQASPSTKQRVEQTINQVHGLINTQIPENDVTRLAIYSRTLSLLEEPTFFGKGTGSLEHLANQNNHPLYIANPHNEYLLVFIENGIPGLLLLIAFFAFAWRESNKLDEHNKWLLRTLVITISFGSLFNSLLLDNKEAHFYVLLLAALMPVKNLKT